MGEVKFVLEKVPVLDHGYVALVESWGADYRIIEAARMSTDKGFLGWEPSYCHRCINKKCKAPYTHHGDDKDWTHDCPNCSQPLILNEKESHAGDLKLLKFLWNNKHFSPFEMCGLTIEVQAPIMVFREWHRHRTQSYNELSARYTPVPDVNYLPTVDRCLMVNGTNKQAGKVADANELTHAVALDWLQDLSDFYEQAETLYQKGLMDGIPKELARLCMPVGRYSRMRASANLRNWFQFLSLRMPENAQWEIRQYSQIVANIVKEQFPRSSALFKS